MSRRPRSRSRKSLRQAESFPVGWAVLGGVVSVLPGSLAAGIRNGALEVHMLDTEDFNLRSLQAEERRVLRLFGMPVVTPRYAGENRGRS